MADGGRAGPLDVVEVFDIALIPAPNDFDETDLGGE